MNGPAAFVFFWSGRENSSNGVSPWIVPQENCRNTFRSGEARRHHVDASILQKIVQAGGRQHRIDKKSDLSHAEILVCNRALSGRKKHAATDAQTFGQIIMFWRNQSRLVLVSALSAVLLLSGCATKKAPYWKKTAYGTWKFSHAEVEKLPIISVRNILSSVSATENEKLQIMVRAQNLEGVAEVKRISGQEDVIVTNTQRQEVKIKIAQITEVQSIRKIMVKPHKEKTGNVADASAEFLIYAPFIPVAIASLPFLRAMGLDTQKNSEDEGKAMMAYGGMSKEDLKRHVGEPSERYSCESKYGNLEIWIYEKAQVLRGGRALLIDLDDDAVSSTSVNTTFFKESDWLNCSVLRR